MLFQVNYKYVHANGNFRASSKAIDAKDEKAAREAASKEIGMTHTHFNITSIVPFKNDNAQKQI